MMAHKGRFKPKNPDKYQGNVDNIIYRSGLEYRVMSFLDAQPSVKAWSSEEVTIRYVDRTKNKIRRYFPDFWVQMVKRDGTVISEIWEVKPKKYTREPKKPQKRTRRYLADLYNWGVNQSKWEYAEKFCEERNWAFRLIDEVLISKMII